MRVLNEYRRIARAEHWCDMCCDWIQPGEQYNGTVIAYKKPNRLIVFKTHLYCESPPDPEDERDKSFDEMWDFDGLEETVMKAA